MTKEYWTIEEVVEIFEIQESLLDDLEAEEIICPACFDDPPKKRFVAGELEKLRLAKILMDEMDVNLPGVEIILRMRQDMFNMRRQFDKILEDLARQVKGNIK